MSRLILTRGTTNNTIGGTFEVFGTTSSETLRVLDGSTLTFRTGFNAGGDTIRLDGPAANFTVSISGSNVTLRSVADDITIIIPIGTVANTIAFEGGDNRSLSLVNGVPTLGSQTISNNPTLPTPVAPSAGGSGTTFDLTSNTDVATAAIFNAGLVFTPGGNDRVNSLQGDDVLTGNSAADVLNVTVGNANDQEFGLITSTLNGIETVNAQFSNNDGTGLDLQDATGLNTVNITRVTTALADGGVSTTGGNAVQVLNMPSSTLNLSISNSVAFSDVVLTYRNGDIGGNESVVLALDTASIETLVVGAQSLQTNHINTLTLDVNSPSIVQNLNMRGGSVETANQTLTIQSGAANSLFTLGADLNRNGNVLDDNSALLDSSRVATINIVEAGAVNLGSVSTRSAGMVLAGGTATGNIGVNVTNQAANAASAFTTGAGNDTVVSAANLAADLATNAGTDAVTISGSILAASVVDLGADNDALTVGTAVTQYGTSVRVGWLSGSVNGGATVGTGAGDDTVALGDVGNVSVGEEAVLNTGAGNDAVTLTGAIAGDTAGAADGDALAGEINLGDGDDTITFNLRGQTNQGTLISGVVNGGAGANVMTVTGNAAATVTDLNTAEPDRVLGIQTLNLIAEQSYDVAADPAAVNAAVTAAVAAGATAGTVAAAVAAAAGVTVGAVAAANAASILPGATAGSVLAALQTAGALTTAINGVQQGRVAGNDDNQQTADYSVEVSEFTGLTNINIRNEAGVTDATPAEATAIRRFVGDFSITTLNNLQGGETINVQTVEAGTGIGEARTIGGIDGRVVGSTELATDVASDVILNLSMDGASTANAATVVIDPTTLAGQIDGDVAISDIGGGGNRAINTLNLTVNGGNRTVDLAAGDFVSTLNLTSGMAAGTTLRLTAVEATTIAAGSVAANLNITALTSEGKTITTGTGNDVVNLVSDNVNASNSLSATARDVIDLGAGTDRIIVANAMRGAIIDADEVFDNIRNVEELEVRGSFNVTLDDDAFITGITTVVLGTAATTLGVTGMTMDLDIGVDFTRAVTVDMASGTSLDVDNDADQNITVNMGTQGSLADNVLNFTDAGTGSTATAVRVTVDAVAQSVGAAGTAANNDVIINNLDVSGEIDSITLLDSVQRSTVPGAAQTATGQISLTLGANWAQASDTLTVNASDINDDDLDANGDGDRTDNGSDFGDAPRGDIGFLTGANAPEVGNDINDTQTVRIDASNANYRVNITASQLVDSILGTVLADTIDGQAGNDFIFGGQGSDALTGGAGNDTFVYGSVLESNGNTNSTDTITDFTTGSDRVRIAVADAVATTFNFGSFANVTSSGDGDNSLQGTNTVRVVGDGFYDSGTGRLIIDVDGDGDITTAGDIQIVTPGRVNAADLDFVISATNGAGVVVRGGQGADTITTGSGADVIVLLGNLTNADVTAYVQAGSAAAVGINTGTTTAIDNVLTYTELTATNGTATEARAGESINGGAGNDRLELFGTVNLVGTTLANIETLAVHTTVTLTVSQLYSLQNIELIGNVPHTIIVVADGSNTPLSIADQRAALNSVGVSVVGSGPLTSFTVGSGSGAATIVAAGSAVNGNLAVGGSALPAGTTLVFTGTDSGVLGDQITNDTTPSFSGVAAPGASVTLYDDRDADFVVDPDEASVTVIADVNGNWTATLPTPAAPGVLAPPLPFPTFAGAPAPAAGLADGVSIPSAFVTGANGLRSAEAFTSLTIDTTAPAAPTGLDLAAASDTGLAPNGNNTDNITNLTAVTVTGSAEPGSSVQLFVGGVANGAPVVANGAGVFSAVVNLAANAVNNVTARATDAAGNVGLLSGPFAITQDNTAPALPTLDLADASDSGRFNNDNVTNVAAVTINGTAEAGSRVVITGGTGTVEVTAAANGTYTAIVNLNPNAVNLISATARDVAGNTSVAGTLSITHDDAAPVAPVFTIGDNVGAIQGNLVDGARTDDTTLVLSGVGLGAADRGSVQFTLNGDTLAVPAALVDSGSGNFTTTTQVLPNGSVNFITATLTDLAGNTSVATAAPVTGITVDTTPPATPVIALAAENEPTFTVLNAGDIVTVTATFGQGAPNPAGDALLVTGSPTLALNIGGTIVQATYNAASPLNNLATGVLAFSYTILAGQTDANGISVDANSVALAGGSIRDIAGNNAVLTSAAVADNAAFRVDTTAPTPAVTAVDFTNVGAGNNFGLLTITGTGFEASVNGGTLNLAAITFDGTPLEAANTTIVSHTDTQIVLRFTSDYLVDNFGFATGNAVEQLVLNTGAVLDVAGNGNAAAVNPGAAVTGFNVSTGVTNSGQISFGGSLLGGDRDDILSGNAFNGTNFRGGAGNDTLNGGVNDSDTFEFASAATNGIDTINFFDATGANADDLDFTAITGLDASQEFQFVAANGTVAGQLAAVVAFTDIVTVGSISNLQNVADFLNTDVTAPTTDGNGRRFGQEQNNIAGDSRTIILVRDAGGNAAVYLFSDSATANGTVEASELTLLANITANANFNFLDLDATDVIAPFGAPAASFIDLGAVSGAPAAPVMMVGMLDNVGSFNFA